MGIVTTCLPYAKLFMESFDSGLVRVDDVGRRGALSAADSNGEEYKLLNLSGATNQAAVIHVVTTNETVSI